MMAAILFCGLNVFYIMFSPLSCRAITPLCHVERSRDISFRDL